MLVTPSHFDTTRGISQTTYEWVAMDQRQRSIYELYASIEEYQKQFEMQFESIVDEGAIFKTLVEKWRVQRGSTSSLTEIVLCPAYQSLIGMGAPAIRLIFSELRAEGNDPDHWFWALQALTGANPVSEKDEGNLPEMARAWLDWAASKGYAG